VIRPALAQGLGLRKDGLGGPIHPGETELFDRAYHRAPVMLEFWGARSYLREKGWDVLFPVEECITRWHASRVNLGFPGQARQWVEHEPDFLDRVARRLGYQFSLHEATFPERVRPGESFTFQAWWRNDGLAPYTRHGWLRLVLRDSQGHENELHRDPLLPNAIQPVGHFESRYELVMPAVPPGEYALLVGMEDLYKGHVTPIRLQHRDDALGLVELGPVVVEGA
jgi:hypothetical protein